MRYLLSTNPLISVSDTLLRTVASVDLGPSQPWTYNAASFTIPASTAPGDYWVGVFIDPSNDVAEFDEADNATYVAKVHVN
jgi:hypothetical protein